MRDLLPLSPDPLTTRATSLAELLGRPIEPAEVIAAIRAAWKDELASDLVAGELTAVERERAEALRAERYGHPDWTQER